MIKAKKRMEAILKQPQWRIIDQSKSTYEFDAKSSFAIDDALCQSIGKENEGYTARTWVHHNTIVLGIQDGRLPHLKEGINFLKSQGFRAVVRNSGGLAVVLDEGVLNLSLILPEKHRHLSIDDGYEAMTYLIQNMFKAYPVTIEAREITGSYCPGRYDLSINGRKFAGISQRRIRGSVAVQIYLCVSGSGSERAALVKRFYELALGNEETRFSYPDVLPETMASLSELLHQPLNVQEVMTLFMQTMHEFGQIKQGNLTPEEIAYYEDHYKRMLERNEKALG